MITLFGKPEPTLAERLRASVSKTKAVLSEAVDTVFLGERKIDPSVLKDLARGLLSAEADLAIPGRSGYLSAIEQATHAYGGSEAVS